MKAQIIVPCPCCSHPMLAQELSPEDVGEHVGLSGDQKQIFDFLAAKFGKPVSTVWAQDSLWRNRIDGGPDAPRVTFAVQLHKIRKKIKPFGLNIEQRRTDDGGTTRMFWMRRETDGSA